ncbi:hypothetical protein IEQ34_015724 [Dendrobium chrysotoxum]|uniref:Uncharacterized protein n=1 Tax=Dendrobium chrysotoxum TaxID=161865 RepID=A0AAV7GIE1_DENCH|nr:hypothetical protein IEQ34_015724 [Dendrobium chrysotoxum]
MGPRDAKEGPSMDMSGLGFDLGPYGPNGSTWVDLVNQVDPGPRLGPNGHSHPIDWLEEKLLIQKNIEAAEKIPQRETESIVKDFGCNNIVFLKKQRMYLEQRQADFSPFFLCSVRPRQGIRASALSLPGSRFRTRPKTHASSSLRSSLALAAAKLPALLGLSASQARRPPSLWREKSPTEASSISSLYLA